jgi:putative flippase GtrA
MSANQNDNVQGTHGQDAAGEKSLTQRLRGMLGERFTRFVGSSLISTALDQILAFLLFGWLRGVFVSSDFLRIFTATLVARVCSVALNYAINMKRVFNDDKADHAKIEEAHAAQLAGADEVEDVELDEDDEAGIDFDDIVEGPDDEVRLGQVEVRPMRESLPRFIALAAFVLFLSSVGVYIGHVILGFNESASKIVCDMLLFFVNYYFQRTWVFARRKRKAHRVRVRRRHRRERGEQSS